MNDKPKKPAVKKLSPKKAKTLPKSDDLSLKTPYEDAVGFGDAPPLEDGDDELLYYGLKQAGVNPDTLDPRDKRGYIAWLAQEEASKNAPG